MKRTASLAILCLTALAAASTAWAADADAGKAKAKSCANCHGAQGEGKGKWPAIAGMDPKKFVAAMEEYKAGTRKDGMMKTASAKLATKDFEDLAAYYATLKK